MILWGLLVHAAKVVLILSVLSVAVAVFVIVVSLSIVSLLTIGV